MPVCVTAGYIYRTSTDSLEINTATRISVQGWNSGMSSNAAANKILSG